MDATPDPHAPAPSTCHDQLVARLQPESEPEERLVRQIALCTVKLAHLEARLAHAATQMHQVLEDSTQARAL
jgi:hypothetical protein